jgi:hypothetical protein
LSTVDPQTLPVHEQPKNSHIIQPDLPFISHNRNTLEKIYEAKKAKYETLAESLSTHRQEKVRVTVVIEIGRAHV